MKFIELPADDFTGDKLRILKKCDSYEAAENYLMTELLPMLNSGVEVKK